MHRLITIAASVALCTGFNAQAALITYSEHAAWSAAGGPSTGAQNFNGFATPTAVASGVDLGSGMSIQSVGDGFGPWTIESAPGLSNVQCDVDGTARLCGDNGHVLTFTFATGISAFGAEFSSLNDNFLRTAFELLSGPNVIATLTPAQVSGQADRFWGFVADDGEVITSMRTKRISTTVFDTFGIDNIETVSAAAVPEPSSLALVALGFLALRRRVRRTRACPAACRIAGDSGPGCTARSVPRVALMVTVAAVMSSLPPMAAAADEKPIATTASQNGKLRVEILSLKRIEADLVTLRWQIVNDDVKDFSMTVGNARLLDLAGRREYSPGIVGQGCRAESGKRTLCWATFGAPPPGTRTMAVKFYENLEMVLGVPVTN